MKTKPLTPPRLTPQQCAAYIERERLTHALALRAGYLVEAAECAAFVRQMMKHQRSATRYYQERAA
jgi:hypothetical protein